MFFLRAARFFWQKVIPTVMMVMMGLMTGMILFKLMFAMMGRGFLRPYCKEGGGGHHGRLQPGKLRPQS